MDSKRFIWRVFSIKKDELRFVLPLFLLYLLSGSLFAVGQIYSETLFLKAYGAEGFSKFFVQNGIVLIFAGILYNFYLLKIPLKNGYYFLICTAASLITGSYLLQGYNFKWLPFYIYMGNYLFTFFLDIHFYNYAFRHLTLRNSKRILPFLMGGGKFGGIVSSMMIFSFFARDIEKFGLFFWAVNMMLLIVPVLFMRISSIEKDKEAGSKRELFENDTAFIDNIFRRIKFSFSSPLFIYSVFLVFVLSVANQICEFYFARIINSSFPTKAALSSFLSLYTMSADFITLIFQFFIISRVIRAIGVRKANYVYPSSFLSLIALALVSPGLITGILLRFHRKNLSDIIRTPVYNIIMAASPRDRMLEVKSFISGIISPLGMIAGGGAILLIYRELSPEQGYVFSLIIGGLYIFLAGRQNSSYVKNLKERISFDKYHDRGFDYQDYINLFQKETTESGNMKTMEALFNVNPVLEVIPKFAQVFPDLEEETKENILNLLKSGRSESGESIIRSALEDSNPAVRSLAFSLLPEYSYQSRKKLLEGLDNLGEAEKHAAVILLAREDMIDGISMEDYYLRRITDLKDRVINKETDAIDFITLIQVIPSKYYTSSLYELALKKRKHVFLKSFIRIAEDLSAGQVRRLIHVFRNASLESLGNFLILAGNAGEMDKAMLLDYRDIPERYMKTIFKPDEKTVSIIIKRLYLNRNYYRKSNYLRYILTRQSVPEDEMKKFIDFEIERINTIQQIIDSMDKIQAGDIADAEMKRRFLKHILGGIIELKKRFILTAISILTGVEIDNIYDSNILLRDRDLNNYILEYIESSVTKTRQVLSVFEDSPYIRRQVSLSDTEEAAERISEAGVYIQNFLPELSEPVKFCFSGFLRSAGINPGDSVLYKEDEMLSLMEKIVFIKDNSLFSELKINEIMNIAGIVQEITIPAGKTIIRKGEAGSELFIIISGEVEVVAGDRVLAKLGPGSCIGELSIIDEEPRSADVITTEKTRMLSINRKDFLLTLKENPAISINIMRVITGRLRGLIEVSH